MEARNREEITFEMYKGRFVCKGYDANEIVQSYYFYAKNMSQQ